MISFGRPSRVSAMSVLLSASVCGGLPGTVQDAQRRPTMLDGVIVEIWSDIACPWCYIGKRRFEVALARFERREAVSVVWRSFELDPGAPRVRDVDNATRLAAKYGM